MGFIYKITNTINQKCYIGQTVKTLEKRFSQHRNNYTKPYFSQVVLYKAFKKYGIENFTFEKVEEISDELLDEREKYWIKFYNSYNDGYNSTIRGRDISLYEWDEEEIINLYHQEKSARKVAKIIRCDHNTIDTILNKNCVKRYTRADQASKPLYFKKNDEFYEFNNTTEAAQWLMDNGYATVENRKIVRQEITRKIKLHQKYFDFEVNYKE